MSVISPTDPPTSSHEDSAVQDDEMSPTSKLYLHASAAVQDAEMLPMLSTPLQAMSVSKCV